MAEMESIKISPLDERFDVGSVYDLQELRCRPGINLWDKKILSDYTTTTLDEQFTYDVVELESLKDKMDHLYITGNQKFAVCAGLSKAGGFHGSVLDAQTPPGTVRVYVKCQIRKMTCTLDTDNLGPNGVDFPGIQGELDASHLITGIESTTDGYFCFTKTLSVDEDPIRAKKDLTSQILDGISKHLAKSAEDPNSNGWIYVEHSANVNVENGGDGNSAFESEIEGAGDAAGPIQEPDLTPEKHAGALKNDEEIPLVEKDLSWNDTDEVSVDFIGDFKLNEPPRTLSEALRKISQIPALVEQAKLTPKMATLVPLAQIGLKGKSVEPIPGSVVNRVEEYIRLYSELQGTFNEMQETVAGQKVEFLGKDVAAWVKGIRQADVGFKNSLAEVYKKGIHNGNWDVLKSCLDIWETSVFSEENLCRSATDMRQTIEIVNQMLETASDGGIEVFRTGGEMKRLTKKIGLDSVICFYLHSNFLDSKSLTLFKNKLRDRDLTGYTRPKEWHDVEDKSDALRDAFQVFLAYAGENKSQKKGARKFVMTELDGGNSEQPFSVVIYSRGASRQVQLPSEPGTPSALDRQTSRISVTLEWEEPEFGKNHVQRYIVEYIQDVTDGAAAVTKQFRVPNNTPRAVILGLKPDTGYLFRVRAVTYGDIVSPSSPVSSKIFTKAEDRLAVRMLLISRQCRDTNNKVHIYTPKDRKKLKEGDVEKYSLGDYQPGRPCSKTILIVGATGTGKTTFLNSMTNFLFGVRLDDDFRFKIVTQIDEGKESAHSVTKKVSAYEFHDTVLPYSLTVIDTPGYGDTEGLDADRHTTKLIKDLFEAQGPCGVDRLDAVCLVVKASDTRLTAQQRHNFNSVMALFGTDIADNIVVVATFADASEPPVKLALEEAAVPYTQMYAFNNSAFFEGQKAGRSAQAAQAFYWEVGQESFKSFFEGLETMRPKSLALSKRVLDRREQLEFFVTELHQVVRASINKLETMRQESYILEKFEAKIKANEHFEYTVTEDKVTKQDLPAGHHTTTCLHCNRTCHDDCIYADDTDKYQCWAMQKGSGKDTSCVFCPAGCHWTQHKNLPYKLTLETQTVTKTDDDLRNQYAKAKDDRQSKQAMLENLAGQFGDKQVDVLTYIRSIREALEELSQIAMRPNHLTDVGYIETLIQAEEMEALPGWQERVRHLGNQREVAQQVADARDPNYDPYKKYRTQGWLKYVKTKFWRW